ncbi:MAG: TetR family transcriptional regulator [Hyphomicrobiales bacterium]|nr:TetR family transcriptional regulator [Hyphomicrobiales bacterium]
MAQAAERADGGGRRNPQRTRARILEAARTAFCARGVDGATMEDIARRAEVNKRMVYHYFGNKEDLYLAVLEDTYEDRRLHDSQLDLRHADPQEGMRRLIRASFDYCRRHPEYIKLLIVENINGARHLRRSTKVHNLHLQVLDDIGELLQRGSRIGLFRAHADPTQVFMTIASLCFFYHSNNATLSAILESDLAAPLASTAREAHVEEVIMGYLRPRTEREGQPRTFA